MADRPDSDAHKALGEFLDRLDRERGPLDTPEDEAEIQRFTRLLRGPPEAESDSEARLLARPEVMAAIDEAVADPSLLGRRGRPRGDATR